MAKPAYRHFTDTDTRPSPGERLYTCPSVNEAIESIAPLIADPVIRRLFQQCFPNTLDTTVYYDEGPDGPDTYIVTGDIPAMWLRDSTNQIWPYMRFVKDDFAVRDLFIGLIHRQVTCLQVDPYANAFIDSSVAQSPARQGDAWAEGVWERKFELDSLASFLQLSSGYYAATGDTSPFTDRWQQAFSEILDVYTREQQTLSADTVEQMFRFTDAHGHAHPAVRLDGYGYPCQSIGLIRSVFRPSDDECVFAYNVPANAMTACQLDQIVPLLKRINRNADAKRAHQLSQTIQKAIATYSVVDHPRLGRIFAYELDGFGSVCLMDDPNIPNLLGLPYMGFCHADDETYQNTRKLSLSRLNPFYTEGSVASGLTSPHTGTLNRIWPLATIMQALTSSDAAEITGCLTTLRRTHANTFFMHESFDRNDAHVYTRPWFGWANALFGDLMLKLSREQPDVLKHDFS